MDSGYTSTEARSLTDEFYDKFSYEDWINLLNL